MRLISKVYFSTREQVGTCLFGTEPRTTVFDNIEVETMATLNMWCLDVQKSEKKDSNIYGTQLWLMAYLVLTTEEEKSTVSRRPFYEPHLWIYRRGNKIFFPQWISKLKPNGIVFIFKLS
jgi:hypothetical protein